MTDDTTDTLHALSDSADKASEAANRTAHAFSKAFKSIASEGATLEHALLSLSQSLQRSALSTLLQPLGAATTQGLTQAFSAGFSALFASAQGNVVQNGAIQAFAQGGVLQQPTYFALNNGSTGLAGEAGAEAIMPLARDSSGRLGVHAASDGKPPPVINFYLPPNADANSFMRSQQQIQNMLTKIMLGD